MTLNARQQVTFSMDQRSKALCRSMKGLSQKAISEGLVQKLGSEAVAHPTVMWYLHAAKFPAQRKEIDDEAGVARPDSVGTAILKGLADNPFSSVRESFRLTCLFRSTIHRRLTESLGFAIRHLHGIPHRLSDDQKTISVNLF
jgi:hypothetical protein